MTTADPKPRAQALTDLILTMFRANNLTLAWGDRIVSPLGLTSARWQILGAITQADRAQPVAWLARDMGANRQNVQRIVNDLLADGLVALEPNPHHKRAQLVVLTPKGKETYAAALSRYNPLVEALAEGMTEEDIAAAQRVLSHLRVKLETSDS
ncbi:MarR family winged helix-turn-helix transcriptional regulator [Pelagibacterium sp. H642]|uniref:MarR family winged helix-turn-helix transcriptional regulator n=1 Tax=Pelagibacterium sp. H642 TaxID=1881069 RepID=UPI0028161721|nr:MarR family winged helix-turn-helix transcriptional regulator [Pelagibacterium sp. H642]WMT92681.1 MarR family winged helix-turn-helix transcriptional regulator [Pelagibacterium sp. H642]